MLTFPSLSLHVLIPKIRHSTSSYLSQASSRCHSTGGGDKVSQSGPVLKLRGSTTVGGVPAVGDKTPHAPEPHGRTQMDPAGWTRTADRWMDEFIFPALYTGFKLCIHTDRHIHQSHKVESTSLLKFGTM